VTGVGKSGDPKPGLHGGAGGNLDMGKKSGRKRAQNPSDFLVRVTAPADAGTFVDAFTALMDRLERPYVVTHEEKRPSFCLSDTGQAFT
jgi:hypothetical protein